VNSLPKTVTRQRRDCDLNPGPSAPESSTLTTRLPSSNDYCITAASELISGWGRDMASVEREPITGFWGLSPEQGPRAEALVTGSGEAKPPPLKPRAHSSW